ncbi:MAG: pseudouridine synthase, partial [Bacteroidales bacterium]|nr:pseudouridine synthase [Bacteroidales bacterium]
MEDNKRGTRKRIVRRPAEGHAEKVDYSTSRSFDSEERRPAHRYSPRPDGERRSYGDRPRTLSSDRPRRDGEEHRSYGDRPRTYSSDRPRRDGEERPSYGDRPRKSGYGKPSFGGSKPGLKSSGRPGAKAGTRKPFVKRTEADAGMRAMLSRKPQVNGRYSDDDTAPTEIKEVVRLNKFIANSGVCSRREADTLIQSGVVTVNGEVVTELGVKVNILQDDIRFNGQRLKGEEKVYIVMNKPKGYVTTASDPHAEKTVMDLLKGCPTRVFPVGRLDKNTTGVLMFTNDGEMAERLTHPSYNKKKIYQVVLDAPLKEEDQQKILAGIELSD